MHSLQELNKSGTSIENYIRNLLQKFNKLGTSIRNYFRSSTNQEPPSGSKSWWFLSTSIPKKLEETYPLNKGIGWEWSPKTHD
jgi:hypothetical protein